jgi:hypothetical protein
MCAEARQPPGQSESCCHCQTGRAPAGGAAAPAHRRVRSTDPSSIMMEWTTECEEHRGPELETTNVILTTGATALIGGDL